MAPQSPAESVVRAVVEKYFASYAVKDLGGLISLWSEKSPDYSSIKQSLQRQFETENFSFSGLVISRVKVESEKVSLRAMTNLNAVNLKSNQKREQRLALNFAFVREDGNWKVWRSAFAEDDLAEALVAAKTEDERAGLLAEEKELMTAELTQALNSQGKRSFLQGDYPRSLAIYRMAQGIAERIDDKAGIARALVGIGETHRVQGDYAQSLEYHQKSLAISEAIGDEAGVAGTTMNIGIVYSQQGDYAQALERFRKSLAMRRALGDSSGVARALTNIGIVHDLQGDYTSSLEYYQQSLAMSEGSEDKIGVVHVLNNIGLVLYHQGNYAQALEYLQKSRAMSEAIEYKDGIASTLNGIGTVYMLQGNYARALESFKKSQGIFEVLGDKDGIATALGNIGNVHLSQGNYVQALEYFQKCMGIYQELGDKAGIADSLENIGSVHHSQGVYAQALEYFRKCLVIHEQIGNREGVARTLYDIGRIHDEQGDYAQALEDLRKSLEIREATKDQAGIAATLGGISSVYEKQGRHIQALDFAERAAALARQVGAAETLSEALLTAGAAHRALDRPTQARQAFEEAITTIESLRAQIAGGEQERQLYFESKVSPYHAMVDLLTREGRLAEALAFAERAKARALLDALQTDRVDVTKAMTGQEQEQERKLKSQLVSLNIQVSRESARPQPDQARLTELKSRLQQSRLDYEAFQINLYAVHPELKTQRGEAQPLRIEEVAALLPDAASALLEYVVSDDMIYLFAITKGVAKTEAEVRVYTLPVKRDDLAKQIEAFRRQLATRDLGFRASAVKLYALLLKPAEAQLQGKTNLIIAPDDKLWDLPFQALLTGANRFLIEDTAIAYAPSLTALREMTKRRKNQGANFVPPTLLALGNPQLGRETLDRATLAMRDEKLDPLPEAEHEVKELKRLYGASRSKIYVGAEAREDFVKNEAGQAAILHFATHGILNDASPMYSHLALARGGAEDGLLEAWELMRLDLKADLAVLSACETARGRFGAGEGMIGLTWALFVAGVPSTVVSQWKVESASTCDLMLGFHRQLRAAPGKTKVTKAEALRRAALKVMKNPETSHPFYWAGFVLVGAE
jgi:CHAT domain-containing protein/Tfp pilus assembly protein PilF